MKLKAECKGGCEGGESPSFFISVKMLRSIKSSYNPASHFTDQEAEPWEVKGAASHKLAVFICKMTGLEQIFSKALSSH